MVIIDWIIDRYLTWRTGKDRDQREWEAWYEVNVNYRATTIPDMFKNFKHVMIVDQDKFMQFDPFTWVPCEDAKQYMHPRRKLGDNAVWRFERVYWDNWDECWHINTMGDADLVFVATNNDRDAMMLALKYS